MLCPCVALDFAQEHLLRQNGMFSYTFILRNPTDLTQSSYINQMLPFHGMPPQGHRASPKITTASKWYGFLYILYKKPSRFDAGSD